MSQLDDMAVRVAALEERLANLTVDDLPMRPLQKKLEHDWRPNAAVFLEPGSITNELFANNTQGGSLAGAFSAYRAAAFNVPVGGATVVFDTDSGSGYDRSGWYDTATGRFTPQVHGLYRLSWCLQLAAAMGAGQLVWSQLYRTGTMVTSGSRAEQSGANGLTTIGTDTIEMNGTTDYAYVVAGVTGALKPGQPGFSFTKFSGELVARL